MKKYKRILLKLSGEALANNGNTVDPDTLSNVVKIIKSALDKKVEVGIVVGGGNIFRGATLAKVGMNRVTGDHMGMLATVINALAIADACKRENINALVMSGFPIGGGVCDPVDHNKAKQALSEGKVVIFSAGTGSPCFTTDTGAVLRGIEIEADVVFKATKVNGVYTADPMKDSSATRYETLSFDEAINKNLQIMDTAAFALCREHSLDICVFSMLENSNTLSDILSGKPLGTIIGK
ncbi:Uridine monophosphate kinase [uncultured Candidatus Thioglobus sp.]|nr:Uridine monophosphate kinase [uncultured Candidatus Thioglobus sp.]SMN02497.1 Uridine monophosphate kinase [uncultured Candidatus Thioglobus sp.]